MNIPKFQLYRVGSDPEALFVTPVDFDYVITPAYDILGKDKKKTTASFIGTDSRPVIAEIRPNPTRNLKRHLYEIAYALTTMQDYLDSTSKWKGVTVLAYPHLLNENLGGHIHASMFIDDPIYLKLKQYDTTMGISNYFVRMSNGEPCRVKEIEKEVLEAISAGTLMLPSTWGKAMSWLLSPFERWIQPWVAREQRNAHYGAETGGDAVRLGTSKAPFAHPGAYIHWEYRLPSTWLHHPRLAYAYLGLAKLMLLNMRTVVQLSGVTAVDKPSTPHQVLAAFGDSEPPTQFVPIKTGSPAHAGETFNKNLDLLLSRNPRISKDLYGLFRILTQCGTTREKWFRRPQPVDIAAWRKLL